MKACGNGGIGMAASRPVLMYFYNNVARLRQIRGDQLPEQH
jgi:hypothetical protein